jgi:hypothetical protein
MTGAFERFGDHTLVLGAGAGAVVRQNFGVGRHKAAQYLRVFVVHRGGFVATEKALLFYL